MFNDNLQVIIKGQPTMINYTKLKFSNKTPFQPIESLMKIRVHVF